MALGGVARLAERMDAVLAERVDAGLAEDAGSVTGEARHIAGVATVADLARGHRAGLRGRRGQLVDLLVQVVDRGVQLGQVDMKVLGSVWIVGGFGHSVSPGLRVSQWTSHQPRRPENGQPRDTLAAGSGREAQPGHALERSFKRTTAW